LLQQLAETDAPVERRLSIENAVSTNIRRLNFDEKSFRFAMNEDAMATEKLAEGIRLFCADAIKLENLLSSGI
jgi:transaldolase